MTLLICIFNKLLFPTSEFRKEARLKNRIFQSQICAFGPKFAGYEERYGQ